MNTVLNAIGDSIAKLQHDDPNSPPPSNVEAVFNVLDKLKDNATNPTVGQTKEGFAVTNGASSHLNYSFLNSVKIAGILALLVLVLSLTQVQGMLDKVFSNQLVKIGILSLVFFVVALVLIKRG